MAANHYEKLTEKANARLKKLVAELSLDNAILKDVDLRECSIIEADMILNELYTSF